MNYNIWITERDCLSLSSAPQGLPGCYNVNDQVDSAITTTGLVGFVTEESLMCYCDAYNLCNDGTESDKDTKEYLEGS